MWGHIERSRKEDRSDLRRTDPELSGRGQLNDSGSHLPDIIFWMTDLGVSEVSAFCDDLGTPVDINTLVSM